MAAVHDDHGQAHGHDHGHDDHGHHGPPQRIYALGNHNKSQRYWNDVLVV